MAAVQTIFDQLLVDARDKGWATTSHVSLQQLRFDASVRVGQIAVTRTRPDSPAIDVLTPTAPEDAPDQSLSAIYGVGPQPLHTDGAHHAEPPHVVFFSCSQTSSVPTMLLFVPGPVGLTMGDDLRNGLFAVSSGKTSFLAPAWTRSGRLRYDPGCMTPVDDRAVRVAGYFDSTPTADSATAFHWNKPGVVLAVDNRNVLHARADASAEPDRALERMSIRVHQWPDSGLARKTPFS